MVLLKSRQGELEAGCLSWIAGVSEERAAEAPSLYLLNPVEEQVGGPESDADSSILVETRYAYALSE